MTSARPKLQRFWLPALLSGLGLLLCLWLVPLEARAVQQHLTSFPDSDARSHQLRPMILGALCFLPAIAALVYVLGGTLDRYLARTFFGVFLLCLSALFLVWLLIDLEDNLADLREGKASWGVAARFYGTRLPAVILLLLPYALLLALLYALGKLSTDREMVAMIQTGRSLTRVTAPLVIIGSFSSALCLGLNYHWAPVAEGRKDELLDAARGRLITEATNVLYRNAADRRLWMVGAFPKNFEKGEPLLNVEVTTTGPGGTLESRMSAPRATWNRTARQWTFENPLIGRFAPDEPPRYEPAQARVVRNWPETPTQLIRPGLAAASLGVPELKSWLRENSEGSLDTDPAPYLTQWHYRWALPFACLVTVLLAVPLAIHFSRRGPGGGVVLAVALSALMMLVSSITLSIGEAGLTHPALAAWLPNIAFSLLALYLFHRRITGRPIYQSIRRLFPVDD